MWVSHSCPDKRTYFCVTSATSRFPDVAYVDRSITCDYDETVCRPDTYSSNGRMQGSECLGSCDESCQISGGCVFDDDCDDCDVCEGGCDDASCDDPSCDNDGCDDASCDEASCDVTSCDYHSCDVKG